MNSLELYDLPTATGEPVAHRFQFPASWEEVTAEQLPMLALARLGNPDSGALRFEVLREMAGIPDALMKRMPAAADLLFLEDTEDGPQRWALLPELDWVFNTTPQYTKSLLPSIEHSGCEWKGPQSDLDRMTMGQWSFCSSLLDHLRSLQPAEGHEPTEEELLALHEARDKALNNWLGAAYQPAHCSWSNEPIEEYGRKLANVPLATKLAAVMNYEALHTMLPRLYPRVFDPTGDGSMSPQGVFAIAFDVARSGVFGRADDVERTYLHRVLGYMEHTLFQDAETDRRRRAAARDPMK